MKLFDKIFLPNEEEGTFLITRERMEDSAPIHVTYASEEEFVIVLTIEEAKELWQAAKLRTRQEIKAERTEEPELVESLDFETYLQSKGIQLHNNQINESKG